MRIRAICFATCTTLALVLSVPSAAHAAGKVSVLYPFAKRNPLKPMKGQPVGCLAASVGRPTAGMDRDVHLGFHFFRGAEMVNDESVVVLWDTRKADKAKLKDHDESRDPFVVCMPPGQYALRISQVVMYDGAMTRIYEPARMPRFPVEVRAGETRYIGALVTYVEREDDGCSGLAGGPRVVLRDRSQEDAALQRAEAERAGQAWRVEPLADNAPALLVNCTKPLEAGTVVAPAPRPPSDGLWQMMVSKITVGQGGGTYAVEEEPLVLLVRDAHGVR